jgi:hypothetical protein
MRSLALCALAASAAVAAFSGCGTDEAKVVSQAEAAAAIRQASTSIAEVDPVTFSATLDANVPAISAEEITISVTASSSVETQQASGVIDTASLARALTANSSAPTLGSDDATIVVSDGTIYLGWSSLETLVGSKWVSLPTDSVSTMPLFPDPETYRTALTSSLEAFNKVSEDDIEVVGTRESNGVTLTDYAFQVPASLIIEGLPADLSIQLANTGITADTVAGVSIPVTASIDDTGIARSWRWSVNAELATQLVAAAGGNTRVSPDFSLAFSFEIIDFGQAFEVEVPNPDDVIDLTTLLKSLD